MSSGMVTRDRLTAVLLTTVTGGITTETGDARYAGKSATETALAGKAGAPAVRYEGNATTTLTTTSSAGAQMHSSMGVTVGTSELWELDLLLFASGGVDGFKVAIDAPSGADFFGQITGVRSDGAFSATIVGTVNSLSSWPYNAGAADMVRVSGLLWTGGTGGTVIPRVAAATNGQTVNVLNAALVMRPAGAVEA